MRIGYAEAMEVVLKCRIGNVTNVVISVGRLQRDGFDVDSRKMRVSKVDQHGNLRSANFRIVRNSREIPLEIKMDETDAIDLRGRVAAPAQQEESVPMEEEEPSRVDPAPRGEARQREDSTEAALA